MMTSGISRILKDDYASKVEHRFVESIVTV